MGAWKKILLEQQQECETTLSNFAVNVYVAKALEYEVETDDAPQYRDGVVLLMMKCKRSSLKRSSKNKLKKNSKALDKDGVTVSIDEGEVTVQIERVFDQDRKALEALTDEQIHLMVSEDYKKVQSVFKAI